MADDSTAAWRQVAVPLCHIQAKGLMEKNDMRMIWDLLARHDVTSKEDTASVQMCATLAW